MSEREEVFTADELGDYERGRELRLTGRPAPADGMALLGWWDCGDGVALAERVAATRNGFNV